MPHWESQMALGRLPHPAVLMGRAVGALDRTLNTARAHLLAGILAARSADGRC